MWTHSYLADVQCNLQFYLQTETYVRGLFASSAHYLPPPLCYTSPTFFPPTLIYSCRIFTLTICQFLSPPLPCSFFIFIYTILSASRPTGAVCPLHNSPLRSLSPFPPIAPLDLSELKPDSCLPAALHPWDRCELARI